MRSRYRDPSRLQLIDDLRRELDYLQLFKLEMEHPGKGKALSEFNAKTREMEMELEVKRLKQVHTQTHTLIFALLSIIVCRLVVYVISYFFCLFVFNFFTLI